jgi:ABC-type transport system substrate-binding protein
MCPQRRHAAHRFVTAAWVAVLLASCATTTTPSSPSMATIQPSGGTLRVGALPTSKSFLETVTDWLDPAGDPGSQGRWFRRCCTTRTLLSYRVGEGMNASTSGVAELVPDLASAMPTVSADGLRWEFHLRAGLHYAPPFEDTVISAGDIVRSIERSTDFALIPGVQGVEEFLADPSRWIVGLETPDPLTLVVRLTSPDGDFPHRLAIAPTAPVPAAAMEGGTLKEFVSSGPYMVGSADETKVVLVRNPSWVRTTDPLREAQPDRIEVLPVESSEAGQAAVADGTLDVVTTFLDPETYQRLVGSGNRQHVVTAQDNAIFQVPINVASPPFDDVHVRRAVALLIDRRAAADAIQGARGTTLQVVDHILPDIVVNGLLTNYHPLPGETETGNLGAAQAEMRLSRYDRDGDGRCDDPVCARVVVMSMFDEGAAAATIAKDLPQLGLDAVVARIEDARQFPPDPNSYDLVAVAGWGAFGPMPSDYAPLWRGAQRDGANLTMLGASRRQLRQVGYHGEVPSLEAQTNFCAQHAGSSAFRCWAELDQLLMEKVVALIPIGTRVLAYRLSDRVVAVEMSPTDAVPALDTIQVRDDATPSS